MAHGNLLKWNNKTRQKEEVRILGCVKQTGGSSALSLNKSMSFQQVNRCTEKAWMGYDITVSSILANLKGQ